MTCPRLRSYNPRPSEFILCTILQSCLETASQALDDVMVVMMVLVIMMMVMVMM